MLYIGFIICLFIGPLQYSDFDKLSMGGKMINFKNKPDQLIVLSSVTINAMIQIAAVVISLTSFYNISKFIELYPEMKIDKKSI